MLLTPLEAVRIRLVSDKTYASGLASGFARMAKEGGLREFYAGFIPIVFKQVPYAIGQFTVCCRMLVCNTLFDDTNGFVRFFRSMSGCTSWSTRA